MTVVNEPAVGFECNLYYNTGTRASPTWVPIKLIEDLSEPEGLTKINVSTRASANKRYWAGQLDSSISFTYLYTKGTVDTVLSALEAYKVGRTPFEIAVADGDISTAGTKYSRDYVQVTKWDKKQPLDDVQKYDVEFSPTVYFIAGVLADKVYETAS